MSNSVKKFVLTGFIVVATILGGCASNTAEQQAAQANERPEYQGDPRDPFEPVNRVMWDFNWDVLDAYILRPVTVGYTTVMPGFARKGLLNAAENLEEPGNFFNNLFQGKLEKSFDSLTRFVLNSTVGLLGTIDVASKLGIERESESFGEVLGHHGVGTGPFLMLPVLGPSDPRSFTGDIVDNVYYPMTVLDGGIGLARFVITTLETRAALMSQEAQLEQSVDDYAFIKNAYFQNLEFQVTDGASAEEFNEEDFEGFEDFEELLEEGDGVEINN